MNLHPKRLILLVLFLFCTTYSYSVLNAASVTNEEYIETGEGLVDDSDLPANTYDIFSVTKAENDSSISYCQTAKIIALNKITAKSEELIFKLGEAKYFGNIEIKIHKCLKNHNPYSPYSTILLTATENKTDEDPAIIFQGWMVSSNAAISTMQHPIYEIFAKDCL
jgi:hypothetical protein